MLINLTCKPCEKPDSICAVYRDKKMIGHIYHDQNYSQNWREFELLLKDNSFARLGFALQLTEKDCDAFFTETPDFSKLEKALNKTLNKTFFNLANAKKI